MCVYIYIHRAHCVSLAFLMHCALAYFAQEDVILPPSAGTLRIHSQAISGPLFLVRRKIPQLISLPQVQPSNCSPKAPYKLLARLQAFGQCIIQALAQQFPCILDRIEILRALRVAFNQFDAYILQCCQRLFAMQTFLEVLDQVATMT